MERHGEDRTCVVPGVNILFRINIRSGFRPEDEGGEPMISQSEDRIILETEHFSYVISLKEPAPTGLYWGPKIDARDADCVHPTGDWSSFATEMWRSALEFPALDGRTFSTLSLRADRPLFLATTGTEIKGEDLTIRLADPREGLEVELHYRVYPAWDAIERFASVRCGHTAMDIHRLLSASVPLPEEEKPLVAHYVSGCWAGEFRRHHQELGTALLRLESTKGMSGPDSSPFLLLSETMRENEGNAYGVMLGWSGTWVMEARRETLGGGRIAGGWNDTDFRVTLEPGDALKTPPLYLCASMEGVGGLSRMLHDLERQVIARPRHPRKVLYNSWEATTFDVRCSEQMALADRAASMGVELFVIDDGWFGQRNSDRAGLGDWYVNPEKFPHGLEELIDHVHGLGMDFGIWVEPESVNPDSDLFRAHPDWIFRLPDQEPMQLRNQYLLDLGKPDVEQFALDMLRGLMQRYRIDYFKWDMNRPITDCCERMAPMAREKQVLAVYRILETLREEYPALDIEACSGGGGRADIGMISRTDQFWVSDNTDPFDRLRIQDGASLCYAPVYTSCWVTDTPERANRQGRNRLKYKFHVAMMGTLGVGANINLYSEEQMQEAAEMIGQYKQIRHLVHEGNLYRLTPPEKENLRTVEFVSRDRSEFALFAFLHSQDYGNRCPRIRLKGLDPEKLYACQATGECRYGRTLMGIGIQPRLWGDFDSCMLHWKAVEK